MILHGVFITALDHGDIIDCGAPGCTLTVDCLHTQDNGDIAVYFKEGCCETFPCGMKFNLIVNEE
jgi:hypothetical protein